MIEYAGGDGSSMEKAVRIIGAENSAQGVQAEYLYLTERFGMRGRDWSLEMQSLVKKEGKSFDVMMIALKDGRGINVYFDITEFFGK